MSLRYFVAVSVCIVAFLLPTLVHAQGYANNWYFGDQNGIQFSGGTPSPLPNNSLDIPEGSVSMSDDQGNLLFYYGGDSVVNANHQQMANGNSVGGPFNYSITKFFATQQPDSAHLYYLFTPTVQLVGDLLLASVIDMSKQGGLGEVVLKDEVVLDGNGHEQVHGVKHANGKDVWIITTGHHHLFLSNIPDTIYAYLLTNAGLSAPVKSIAPKRLRGAISQMKMSPGGDFMAVNLVQPFSASMVFQFDNATGVFSNPIEFHSITDIPRGIEFSCDASKLYITSLGFVNQFDLSTYDSVAINTSRISIPQGASSAAYLQLGPDQNIYVHLSGEYRFGVIENAHLALGAGGATYNDSLLDFANPQFAVGLPSFEPTCLCTPTIFYQDVCVGDTTQFQLNPSSQIDSVFWDFDDPSSGLANSDTGLTPEHVFSGSGTFSVQAIYYRQGLPDTTVKLVEILPYPAVDLGPDTLLCAGDVLLLNAINPGVSYLWDNGSTLGTRIAISPDTVWVTQTNSCGAASDTLVLDSVTAPILDLGPDTILCPGDSFLLTDQTPGAPQYTWNTGSTNDSLWVSAQGTYAVTVDVGCYAASDTIVVDSLPFPAVQLGNDTVLCEGDTIAIQTNTTLVDYLWQDSSTIADFQVLVPDTFWVQVSNVCGAAIDTIVIDSLIPALVQFPGDSILCTGDTVILDASIQLGSYQWQDASTNSSFTVTQTGTYWAEAVNSCGTSSDTVFFDFLDVPVFDLGNDTILCAGDSIQLQASSYLASYNWENALTDSIRWIHQDGTYSLTVSNQCFSAADTITIQGIDVPDFSLGPDTFLCEGYSQSLFASGDLATFLWHNGSTDSTILFSSGGQKWAEASNVCGSFSDTVFIEDILFPMVALPGDTALCENDSLLLNASFAGAWYLWNNSSTDSVRLVQEEGFYRVEVTNECGTVTDSLTMTLEDSLLFSLGVDTLLCLGDSLLLSTFLSNDYPHFWQDTAGLNSFLVLVSGNYWVFVENACGEAADTVVVGYTQEPTLDLGASQLLCSGDSTALVVTNPFSTYAWNTTDTTDTLWVHNTGTYTVTTTNKCGVAIDSVQIDFDDTLLVELGPAIWSCVGTVETLTAQVSGAADYQWSTGFVTEQIKVDTEDDYWLDVTNICGTVRDSVRVSYREVPEVTVSADTQICAGAEAILSGISNNDTLQWNTGIQGSKLTVSNPGVYWLQSTNYCGSARDSVRVGVQAKPEIVLPASLQICPGEKRLLQPFPPTLDYFWQDGSNRPDFLVEADGTYQVIGYSDIGCADTASVLVGICPSLWVPSAFTPDGDGLNDVFKVEGESLDEFELQVFNRWGQLMFSTRNPRQGWNGIYRGQLSAQGVYSWKVFFINQEGEEEIRAGSVTLVR